ncbi:hypothetical protein M1367_00790 [Candidatus Marsarchaeota archaeon]|jgi:hypothetical protein|nr:hypothetical protein [Candidatus Marsarchaeota archaeon]
MAGSSQAENLAVEALKCMQESYQEQLPPLFADRFLLLAEVKSEYGLRLFYACNQQHKQNLFCMINRHGADGFDLRHF